MGDIAEESKEMTARIFLARDLSRRSFSEDGSFSEGGLVEP